MSKPRPLQRPMTVLSICLLLLVSMASGHAATPQQLIDEGRLSVDLLVETEGPLYARSPIIIAVEVATPRWFSRGTRIRDFRVPGAVVRPVSSFADNQTQRRGNESWSVQRWRYRLFAQEAGDIVIPKLSVAVAVNGGDAGNVEGQVMLPARTLSIEWPPGIEGLAPWVSASSLTIEESWEGELEDYQAGDVVTRVRRYQISDAPAMVLVAPPTPDIDGLSLYRAPPVVKDSQNRGQLQGEREERLIVTFTAPGDYELPGLTYHWLDTDSGEVHQISIPSRQFSVGGVAAEPSSSIPRSSNRLRYLTPALVLCLVAMLLYSLRGRSWVLVGQAKFSVFLRQLKLRRRYHTAARHEDSARCLELLYKRLAQLGAGPELSKHVARSSGGASALEALLAHAWGSAGTAPTREQYAILWRCVTTDTHTPATATLMLNPGSSLQHHRH